MSGLLVCEDGRTFPGEPYGAVGTTVGEVVFTTGMTGYQETLTDPSYHRQVLVMTAPHIGNTGTNDDDAQSGRIWVAGLVVREPARRPSSWRARRRLEEDLADGGVVGLAGVDTRALTRHLRERGAMRAGIATDGTGRAELLERVRASPGMVGADLAREAATAGPWTLPAVGPRRHRVALLDLGAKAAIAGQLAARGCEVAVHPAATTADQLLAGDPDGVLVSNGPGDPATAGYAVAAVTGVLRAGVPLLGICFGHQVLARALGLATYKLPFGHRGANQPVADRGRGRVLVTSHNHGFAVAADPDRPAATPFGPVEVSHLALNDGVVEGLRCRDLPARSVQFHPEAAAGPHDATGVFAEFVALLDSAGRAA